MKPATQRIRELAASNAIDETEAARLMAAVGADRADRMGSTRQSILENPFAKYGGEVTTPIGVVACALGVLASHLGVRFDGALDVHTVSAPISLRVALLDQAVAFLLTAIVFWLAARLASKRARLLDVLGVVGAARALSVLCALPLGLYTHGRLESATSSLSFGFAALVALSLAALATQIYLLYVGFRTVSNLRGGRLTAVFVGALVAAEIAAKVALSFT